MQDQIAATEDCITLARQFYDSSLERVGEDHEQTRGLLQFISNLERRLASARSHLEAAENMSTVVDNCEGLPSVSSV
jgi:hypothetical protein